jgi:peptide deformylase
MTLDFSASTVTDENTTIADLLTQLAEQLGLKLAAVQPGTKVNVIVTCLEGVSGA